MLLSENSTSESEVSQNMLKNRFFVMKTSRPWSNWISCYFLRKFTKSISEYTVLSFVGIHKEHFQTMLISFIGTVLLPVAFPSHNTFLEKQGSRSPPSSILLKMKQG
jgi:hypothetical protein